MDLKRQPGKTAKSARTTPAPVIEVASLLPNLVDDVSRFFMVIEFLDENRCFQKFVCNVHLRAKYRLFSRPSWLPSSKFRISNAIVIAGFLISECLMHDSGHVHAHG